MNWYLDLSWMSFGLKIQSMCALRAKISEHLYICFWLHLQGAKTTGRETRVHVPGLLIPHLKPAPQVCFQFCIKSLGDYLRVQGALSES